MRNKGLRYLIQGAIIAALYVALTLIFAPISFGAVQVRVSEMLCVLPFFTPAAVPGLFIGCLIGNTMGPNLGIWDIVAGSLATLLSAFLASRIKNKWLVPLPAVLINAVVVGILLNQVLNLPLWASMLSVGVGQVVACYVLGLPLLLVLQRYGKNIFKADK